MKCTNSQLGQISPAKKLLVAVLALVLVGVLLSQFAGERKKTSLVPRKRTPKADKGEPIDPSTSKPSQPVVRKGWPEIELVSALKHDPFAMPLALRPRIEEPDPAEAEFDLPATARPESHRRRQKQLEFVNALKRDGVDLIVMTEHGRVARIGERNLREGDVVEGLRVEQIHEKGVVFVPAENGRDEKAAAAEQ